MSKGKNEYVVDKSKLTNGLVINNHPTLCYLMGWKAYKTTSASGQAQIKALGLCCKYHKEGKKYIIDEVYENKLESIDGRSNGGNSIFKDDTLINMIEIMLVNNSNDTIMVVSKYDMYRQLGLVNKYYHELKRNVHKGGLSEVTNVDRDCLQYFFSSVDESCESVVKNGLNKLANNGLVEWRETRIKVIVTNNDSGNKEVKHIVCTDREVDMILNVERSVCKEMGYKNTWELSHVSQQDKDRFYNRVQLLLNLEYRIPYTYSYKAYKIIYNKRLIKQDLIVRGVLCAEKYITRVNDTFVNAIMNKFERRVNRVKNKNFQYKEYSNRVLGLPKPQEETKYALNSDDLVVNTYNFIQKMQSLISIGMTNVVIDKLEKELIHQEEVVIEIPKQVYTELEEDYILHDYYLSTDWK